VMEIPFPRGGSGVKKSEKTEKRERNESTAHSDDLFQTKKTRKIEIIQPTNKKTNNKRKRDVKEPSAQAASSLQSVGLGMAKPIGSHKALKIDSLNYSKYFHGVMALGFILQVTEESLIVSLPGGMTATVPFSEVSDIHFKHFNHVDDQVPFPLPPPPSLELFLISCRPSQLSYQISSRFVFHNLSLSSSLTSLPPSSLSPSRSP
jgi:hypothetical protein